MIELHPGSVIATTQEYSVLCMIYVHACIYQNFGIMKLFTFLSLPGANNAVIYIVVEFDKELGVNGSTMEVMPDNWRDHEGNLCVLYPYY